MQETPAIIVDYEQLHSVSIFGGLSRVCMTTQYCSVFSCIARNCSAPAFGARISNFSRICSNPTGTSFERPRVPCRSKSPVTVAWICSVGTPIVLLFFNDPGRRSLECSVDDEPTYIWPFGPTTSIAKAETLARLTIWAL